ncbi:MAG: response regulator [Phaeodactylibacter xiamenensis]|uniref:response regulator n=1 Tax=Phaeodactylibacter xiamenensis TaxID=1524460 RepID=UPI00069668B8|nr:response regulator transcription factor [Phaeodactylibacter xiamenensis]MCR9050782.1 response regulator transcription factor [bacterium]
MPPINILIADDHHLLVKGLKDILQQQEGWIVTGTANNSRQALSLMRKKVPDLLITDLNMPGQDGFELILKVKKQFPKVKILVLTIYRSPGILRKVNKAGVHGIVLKEQKSEAVIEAVSTVLNGKTYSPPETAENEQPGTFYQDAFTKKATLTRRELEVLVLIVKALNNKQIGEQLFISEYTVQTHRRNLKRKLEVDNTAELVRFAIENKIV